MRYFFEEYIADQQMMLSPESSKHIVKVLRMQVGDEFVLVDGKGTRAVVQMVTADKNNCVVKVLSKEFMAEPVHKTTLVISFTKNSSRMEWLLEKITEIGIAEIIPLQSKRSERTKLKTERWQKILVSAMLQSQQYYLPKLSAPISFDKAMKIEANNKLIAHCIEEVSKASIPAVVTAGSSSLLCIGPEGDFTKEEVDIALQHNFKSISLGNNRLRTETAGLVGVTLLQYATS